MREFGDLSGRIALVTGGGRNIGRATAAKLAEGGARVAVTYQSDEAAARSTCGLIGDAGGECIAVQLELTEPESIDACVGEVKRQLGPVDILINNVGIRPPATWDEITADKWDAVMNVNVRGPFLLSQLVIPHMLEQRWGRIMVFSGVHAYLGARFVHLGASKLAQVGLVRSLSTLHARSGITVNVVVPGFVDTHHTDTARYGDDALKRNRADQNPVRRLGQPDEIGDLCRYLASDQAAYITGQEIFATGGTFPGH